LRDHSFGKTNDYRNAFKINSIKRCGFYFQISSTGSQYP
jgi:hypothetical protein